MHILFVCTGNLCRSPFAERRTADLLAGAAEAGTVGSAGTRAVVGAEMDPATADVLAAYGSSPAGHRARALTKELVTEADLVLTMTADHRTAVLALAPVALRRTFTLLEAATLLGSLDRGTDPTDEVGAEHLRAMTRRLSEARSALRPPHPGFPDVVDPIGRPREVHREVGKVVDEALHVLLPRLVPGAAA